MAPTKACQPSGPCESGRGSNQTNPEFVLREPLNAKSLILVYSSGDCDAITKTMSLGGKKAWVGRFRAAEFFVVGIGGAAR